MRRAALQLYERADVLSVDENRPLSDYTRSKILSCIGPVWPRETAPGVVLQPGPATGMKVHERVEIRVNSGVLVGAERGSQTLPARREGVRSMPSTSRREIKWASDQEAVTFLGYRPIRSWIGSEVILLS